MVEKGRAITGHILIFNMSLPSDCEFNFVWHFTHQDYGHIMAKLKILNDIYCIPLGFFISKPFVLLRIRWNLNEFSYESTHTQTKWIGLEVADGVGCVTNGVNATCFSKQEVISIINASLFLLKRRIR